MRFREKSPSETWRFRERECHYKIIFAYGVIEPIGSFIEYTVLWFRIKVGLISQFIDKTTIRINNEDIRGAAG